MRTYNPRRYVQNYTPAAATLAPRGPLRLAVRAVRLAWTAFELWELEAYRDRADADGLLDAETRFAFDCYMRELRGRLERIARA